MQEHPPSSSPPLEEYLKSGIFILQADVMRLMLPRLGIKETEWDARGYADAFRRAFEENGKNWWERYQNGERDDVIGEAQEKIEQLLRGSIH